MTDRDEQVEILTVNGTSNAEPVLAALRANGIPAAAIGESVGRVYGLTLDGLGMVKIVVPKAYEEQARGLIEAGELEELRIREDGDLEG